MIWKLKKLYLLLLIPAGLVLPAFPQSPQAENVKVYEVELAVPFGTAEGNLMTVDEYLIFVNRSDESQSFALRPDQIQSVEIRESILTVAASEPVQTVGGQSTRSLTFRLKNPTHAADLRRWKDAVQPAVAGLAPARPGQSESEQGESRQTYQVMHNHFVGECRGTLTIGPEAVSYDSTDNIDHSQRWAYSEIRELELENPYQLEVDAFIGRDYNFRFMGEGMDPNSFNQVRERIGKARGLR